MSSLADFLDHLFATGEARLTGLPELVDVTEVHSVLGRAFAEYRLDVAGPPVEFDSVAGAAAALFMARSCWFAVSREETPEQIAALMPSLAEPTTAAAHLSIDLTLRYAVTVHRRVAAQSPDDALARRLADSLRRCPLTGGLSDIADPPTGDTAFAGHCGLELLYAERLTSRFRPSWLPATGRTREAVELVYQQQGKSLPETSFA